MKLSLFPKKIGYVIMFAMVKYTYQKREIAQNVMKNDK